MEQAEIAERLIKVEARCASNTHRLDDMGEQTKMLNEISRNLAVMAQQQRSTAESLLTLTDRVAKLEERPVSAWDKAWQTALTVLITAAVTMLISGRI